MDNSFSRKCKVLVLALFVMFLFGVGQAQAETISFPGELYEAEEADGEGTMVDNKHVGFTGDGFIDFVPNEPGGYLNWTVEVEEEAEYVLAIRYAHGKPDNRHARLEVNENVVNEQMDFPQTGDFVDYVYVTEEAMLQEGTNEVTLTATAPEGGANIDHLYVYRSVDELKEAEDANGDGIIIDNKHAGFTGDGFVDFNPNVPGGYIEWVVELPVEATYNVDFRYAHAGGSNRPAEISVNGETMQELEFPPTGDWAEWKVEGTKLQLPAGENVIRLTATGAEGGGNIDHLRIHNQKSDSENNGPVITEKVELEELVPGLTLKKLKQLGVVGDAYQEDQLITGVELLALINREFGFDQQEVFKNMSDREAIGHIPADEWGIYAAEIAKANEYVPSFLWEDTSFQNPLEKEEIALIVGDLLDMVSEDEEGSNMLGKLARQGIMNPNSPNNYGVKEDMTWGEAIDMVDLLVKESNKPSEDIHIARADVLTEHFIAVTLNGELTDVDVNDIKLSLPNGSWSSLSPLLSQHLRAEEAAVTQDRYGNTVIIYEVIESLDGDQYIIPEDEPTFNGDLQAAIEQADNMVSWQIEHGGWSKAIDYSEPWDGEATRSEWVNSNGVELGMIDNDATIKEMEFLAEVYAETGDEKYRESFQKGLAFLFDLQYDTGGFAQVYPRRGNYSDMVTFNDEAMIRVINMFEDIVDQKYPFHTDIVTDEGIADIEESLDLALDYILKSQIVADGEKTAWGQQHHPQTYEPVGARSYEHPSISGKESVAIVQFLMERMDQSNEIKEAVLSALKWYDEVKVEGVRYVSGGNENGEYFVEDENAVTWYRFYEIGTNKPIFSGRDGVIKHDIHEIEAERRNGYQWGGSYGQLLLETAKTTGYFEGNIYAQVVETNSANDQGYTLVDGQVEKVEDFTDSLAAIENKLVVATDESGDYQTVQAAIDAVPNDNQNLVDIFVKNGVYKEVITVPADKPFINLIGEDEHETVIHYDNYAGKDNGVGGTIGTSNSATAFFRANDFLVQDITIENSFDESVETDGKQAVAVYATGERMIFDNVRLLGNQDTLFAHSGSQYYYNSYIEGDVDFIFGAARAVFENSTIHSLDRGSDSNNGYITAASTQDDQEFGFLFLNSTLTSDAKANTVYLGRPWQPSSNPSAIAHVVYKNSHLGEHIKEEGWTEMGGFQPEDAKLYEYENEGPGAIVNDSRRQLTDEEAANYTVENVLDGWVPNVSDS
ncbi:pectate lyase [Gracilibacillus sp. YIM 98692]|uniref:pectate lyase n=1 Tax=Gracilibacillus sp. YIM 98692 TaxID=2663532 RepID=UPI0013D2B9FF|nr:pectate lyase [Gracilibacillus sp. YIM 98692]